MAGYHNDVGYPTVRVIFTVEAECIGRLPLTCAARSWRGVGQIRTSTMSCHRLTLSGPHRHAMVPRGAVRLAFHGLFP